MNDDQAQSCSPCRTDPQPSGGPAIAHAQSAPDTPTPLNRLQQELLACQRRIVLGDLAAIAAHELNNLLTPVITRTELALTSGDVAYMRKTLERTLAQSQRAVAVNRHLLDLARGHPLRMAVCSLAKVVREAVETTSRPFEKDGIELQVSVPAELEVVACEPLLGQVLLNLLLNARKAMKGLTGPLTISAASDGDYVRIDVRDSGHGLSRERIESVLNPFLAADPRQQTNDWPEIGLGLNACRMIAHLHGATIRVLPNEGRGVTFRLRWPKNGPVPHADA